PNQSMFPTYDHSKSLYQQQYFPHGSSLNMLVPTPVPVIAKGSSASEKQMLKRADSAMGLTAGYEHIPRADEDDLVCLFKASTGKLTKSVRKLHLSVRQPDGSGMSLSIGSSAGTDLYTLASQRDLYRAVRVLTIVKHHAREKATVSAAQLELATTMSSRIKCSDAISSEITKIFPHIAALKAIEAMAESPEASTLTHSDPLATTNDATRISRKAILNARCSHEAALVRKSHARDSTGAATAIYELQHPSLGVFAVHVDRSQPVTSSRCSPKAKITMHHPSATPAAILAETLVLASLDFARDSCVLDLPALMALGSPYILDTVVCTLFAVTIAENDHVTSESLIFDPPPLAAALSKDIAIKARRSRSSGPASATSRDLASDIVALKQKKWYKPFSSKSKMEKEIEKQKGFDELPALTQAALALLGISFKTAVFVLEASVKVTAGLVIGASHVASKA
ncbi:hypothetical protein K431DRAFT_216483, partial [Polychaeton citri CBS 116435]